jgi:nucleotide sugar dehydrogenase
VPPVLNLTKDNIETAEQRAHYTVGLIGCSQRAVFAALAFADAGFKVKCADSDQSVTRRLSKANVKLGNREAESKLKTFVRAEQITASSDLKATVATSDVLVVNVNTKVNDKKGTDRSEAENICKQVGAALPKSSLVIYAGIGGFGFTDEVVKENLENTSGLKAGVDFGLAYSLDIAMGQAMHARSMEMTVAADDKFSLDSAALIIETIAKQSIKKTLGIKNAELSALFDAVRRDSKVALANELATFCEAAGVDYTEVQKLTGNNRPEDSALPTISEELNRNEAYMLLENAENLNTKLKLPALARQVNEDMIRHATNLTQDAMRSCGKTLRRAKVALLGASLDPGTARAAFVAMLDAKGAKVTLYDPYGSDSEQTEGDHAVKKTLNEAAEGTDCVVVLSEQELLKRLNLKKLRAIMKSPAAFVDLTSQFEPAKVEEAGFTYRGLGRGVWKK